MIIVAGHLEVAPVDRDRYVHAFASLVEQARNAPGCLDLAISADSVGPGRINTFELWASQEDLDAFRAQADVPETGIEIRQGSMNEYVIDPSRDPFTAG